MFPSHHYTTSTVWKLKAGEEGSVGPGKGVTAISGATVPPSGMRYVKCPGSRAVSSSLRREERACAGPDAFCPRRRRSTPRGFRGLSGRRACQCDPVGEKQELWEPRTQRAAPRLSSPGSRASPVSHFGGGPRGILQLFLRCPCWGVPVCPACGRTGVTWPPCSPGAEGLRGSGAGAICTGHSQGRPSRAAPGVTEGLVQLQKQGPVSRGEHT